MENNCISREEVEKAVVYLSLVMGKKEAIEWEFEGEEVLIIKGELAKDLLTKAKIIDSPSH